jgi:hypothetical protein
MVFEMTETDIELRPNRNGATINRSSTYHGQWVKLLEFKLLELFCQLTETIRSASSDFAWAAASWDRTKRKAKPAVGAGLGLWILRAIC